MRRTTEWRSVQDDATILPGPSSPISTRCRLWDKGLQDFPLALGEVSGVCEASVFLPLSLGMPESTNWNQNSSSVPKNKLCLRGHWR